MTQIQTIPSQTRLRDIAWEIGSTYPAPLRYDSLAFYMVTPQRGHVHWHLREDSLNDVKVKYGDLLRSAPLVIRVYDVTDVVFNGFNAHRFFDLDVHGLSGNYYVNVPQLARNYLAEIGLRGGDGSFHYLARSLPVFFERDRASGDYATAGLFVGGAFKRTFPVENIFDAPVYEQMHAKLRGIERQETLSVAMIFLGLGPGAGLESALGGPIKQFPQRINKFDTQIELFAPAFDQETHSDEELIKQLKITSDAACQQIRAAHQQTPFHIVHCHDWYSLQIGFTAAKKLNLPLVLSLHSTEYERTQGYASYSLSPVICAIEKDGAEKADLVIVPHSSTRQQVLNMYEADPEKVVIIPDVFEERAAGGMNASGIREWLNIDRSAPVVLFAGAMSHAAGADLLVDALPQVCGRHPSAIFVFAGDGPLKDELQGRVNHSAIGQHCRFLGDVKRETFEALLLTADFVAIPARTWQDDGLAQAAIACGKPVLTTHQAGIRCVAHGQNGLVTYDNPGSIVWGVQEMLANPLHGSMLRLAARQKANESVSLDQVIAQHYMYYEILASTWKASYGE